jgi:bifunctional DNA-binding transcriptional regulator/antitoxin component of YhaV-PrlF toxin-antitoxin module
MTDDAPDLRMNESDPVDEVEKYTLQTDSRVKIPEKWAHFLDIDEGDDMVLVCKEDKIIVAKWSLERIQEM